MRCSMLPEVASSYQPCRVLLSSKSLQIERFSIADFYFARLIKRQCTNVVIMALGARQLTNTLIAQSDRLEEI